MKNWKTTLSGLFLSVVTLLTPYIETGVVTIGQVLTAVGIATLGIFSKDATKKKENNDTTLTTNEEKK